MHHILWHRLINPPAECAHRDTCSLQVRIMNAAERTTIKMGKKIYNISRDLLKLNHLRIIESKGRLKGRDV